jgi:hypothetical protein
MKFEKLMEVGRGMEEAEIAANLQSLASEPRFAAVVALIHNHREQYVDGGCVQALADSHGKLAHNAGSVYALNVLLGRIRQVCNPPKRRGQQPPEKAEE